MNKHHADKFCVYFSEVSLIYVEFTQQFHWASIWPCPRYLTLDLGLGAVLAMRRCQSLKFDPYRIHTDMVETHGSWVPHVKMPQSGIPS